MPKRGVGAAVRVLRVRKAWRQEDLAHRLGVSRQLVSRIERDEIAGVPLGVLQRTAAALDARLNVELAWHGAELERLLDAGHAELQDRVARWLEGVGWRSQVEASFNHYGDRGRYDILAFHPTYGVLAVVEIKTAIGDAQETLGRLDVKVRLARQVAAELGWVAHRVVPALVIADRRAQRRHVARHAGLFGRFEVRGRRALAWLRQPSDSARGLLWFLVLTDSHPMSTNAGSRVRNRPNAHRV